MTPFSLFFLASLEIQSAYDNHRLLILSTGRDKNFSQRFLRAQLHVNDVNRSPLKDKLESTVPYTRTRVCEPEALTRTTRSPNPEGLSLRAVYEMD